MASRRGIALLAVAALALCCAGVGAAKVGDEQFRDAQEGRFFSFAEGRFDVVDPVGGRVLRTVNVENATWGDAVYIESLDGSARFVVVGEQANDQLLVIDTETAEIVDMVDMGDRPVHIYAVHYREEVWVHADDDGTFDILHLNDTSSLLVGEYQAFVSVAAHGKLAFDESLGNLAYATNTKEPGIVQLDLETKEHLEDGVVFHNLTELNDEDAVCPGTHGIAFSKVNRHLYVECSSSSGIFEFSIDEGRVVSVFKNVLGQPTTTPDGDYVLVPNKKNSTGHILVPKTSGEGSSEDFVFDIPGMPDKVAFFPKTPSGDALQLQDYYAFFSLVEPVPETGVAWVDLADVLAAPANGTERVVAEVITTGMVERSHRGITRGGPWVATHSWSPISAMSIIDAEKKEVLHQVEGVGNGTRLLYVPK